MLKPNFADCGGSCSVLHLLIHKRLLMFRRFSYCGIVATNYGQWKPV